MSAMWLVLVIYMAIGYLIRPQDQYYNRSKRMDTLLSWHIYKSDRFVVTGNIGYRVVITDLHEDKSYEIQYGDLVKFRTHWVKVKHSNKETLLIATISSKKGRQAADREKAA